HNHLREELKKIKDAVNQVAAGQNNPSAARSLINQMTMRQNYWALGSFCASYCRLLTVHHVNEDDELFAELKDADGSLSPVIERLAAEHEVIAAVLTRLDAALVDMVEDVGKLAEVRALVDLLDDVLLSHLAYEEEEVVEPLGRLNVGGS
ncbi:hemerythrin domain-containing protein, partial [Phytoactinopolyspora endophytica]|uniref:hemerythrin domain-containing protein n=1 Tax=Phytoactinopolyspora endophytica TaxID=1642495 RepID=UPI00197B19D2